MGTHSVRKALAAAALLLGLLGCTSTSDVMQSWVGNTQHDLILKWGPPTRTASDGADGIILIYEYTSSGQIPGQAYVGAGGVVFYTAPQSTQRTATRMFYVNSAGVIYSWRWQD